MVFNECIPLIRATDSIDCCQVSLTNNSLSQDLTITKLQSLSANLKLIQSSLCFNSFFFYLLFIQNCFVTEFIRFRVESSNDMLKTNIGNVSGNTKGALNNSSKVRIMNFVSSSHISNH